MKVGLKIFILLNVLVSSFNAISNGKLEKMVTKNLISNFKTKFILAFY